MEELLKLNPDAIKGSVRITFKDGAPRVRFIVTKTQDRARLGEGAYKACYKAIRIGGKFAERMKMVVTYETSSKTGDFEFLNDAKESLKYPKNYIKILKPMKRSFSFNTNFMMPKALIASRQVFAEGGELSIDQATKLSNPELKNATQRLLRAGQAMERNQFSHNDLKFGNIFIKDGEVVIGDLGFMRRNCTQGVGGTPGYIPPDLMERRKCPDGIKHDNFSVGVMLLCMYTGVSFVSDFDPPAENARQNIKTVQRVLKNLQPETPMQE